MEEKLFLSAEFGGFKIGFAKNSSWFYTVEEGLNITSNLIQALEPCINLINFDVVKIFILNGPGSTLGIRTICAFVRTLIALNKINEFQVFVCDNLHFVRLFHQNLKIPICARVNVLNTLCLDIYNNLHEANDYEKSKAVWIKHKCLDQKLCFFDFKIDKNLLKILDDKDNFWKDTKDIDVFAY